MPTRGAKKQGRLKNGHIRWNKEGEDTVVIYRALISNCELRFVDFLKTHSDWLERYRKETLRRHFKTSKDNLEAFFDGSERE